MNLENFINEYTPSPVEIERRNRIKLSVAAYAYEFHADSIISDAEFDNLSDQINVQIRTGNERIDDFFCEHFEPHTGMWIQKHPDRDGLEKIYQKHYKKKRK
jgi:hypothetical protein